MVSLPIVILPAIQGRDLEEQVGSDSAILQHWGEAEASWLPLVLHPIRR